ncbi:hypothetical protein C900_00263 [Fulvivirga imtechensis AK7]|uniref:Peptidase M43 pregnancy-associated plasma-A domain-containing protein n=1 Tax=Fulvivirga imtechensis AK7 TaxID=1237149 RepID=L8JMA6_9BACT|nr:choice-of-anchor J domain-containing protein [Fulvivirga imtechensis]ELR68522.1 hypothetical protein C900_00263 [Fulvivirga imtechensis AK7]
MLLSSLYFISTHTLAQRCATVEYQKLRQQANPKLENESEFEDWLKQKIEERKNASYSTSREQATVYKIPVVVHVIHNGEALGVGRNIPDAQIISQIEVLTEDFRRMNTDASNTPASFIPVAADVELEFVLAQRDPEGLPTDGIVRVNGQQSEWALTENYELKSLSYWPAEDYLNIWVADISGNYLGYAQFPVSNSLPGLENGSNSRVTDGVVIDFRTFGSKDKYPPANLVNAYNLGRTTTHEIGHYFGLRHIWGDDNGGCNGTDYVNDTPNQGGSTSGCPATSPTSCTSEDMVQNYMDYTDDACMNLFTSGQKTRIRTILDNSPRRASLKASKGAIAPVVVSNDLGIRKIINPGDFACSGSFTPSLQIRNYGDNAITSFQITLTLDGAPVETASFSTNLDPLEIDVVEFSPINISTGDHTLHFAVTQVNGTADGNTENDESSRLVTVPAISAMPITDNFNTLTPGEVPSSLDILNPDGLYTWETTNADGGNISLFVNFYDYEIEGEYDTLLSPVFDLTTVPFGIVAFDRAYAKYPTVSDEGLIVALSTNCGKSFDHILYEAYGDALATVPQQSAEYKPAAPSDWKRESIILGEFQGMSGIRVAFISKNGYGNNLYLDNILIDGEADTTKLKDLAILSLITPSVVSCSKDAQPVTPVIQVKNDGYTTENEINLTYQFDDGKLMTASFNITLAPGAIANLPLAEMSFDAGEHSYVVNLNNSNDNDLSNDEISGRFYINNEKDFIPIKENFEDFDQSNWVIISNDEPTTWQTIKTNKGTSLFLDSENYTGAGQDEWLVSPVLDFSSSQEATLSFNIAYSYVENTKDGLTVLVSTDCGVTYEDVIFSKYGEDLHTGTFTGAPESDSVWSKIDINMINYVDEENLRIAFISTNSNGGNIYLDNIQIFVTDHLVSGDNVIYPNPSLDGSFNVTFDLPEKETVEIIIYDRKGQIITRNTFENTLNQTYSFNYENQAPGIYFVKVVSKSSSYVKRIALFP